MMTSRWPWSTLPRRSSWARPGSRRACGYSISEPCGSASAIYGFTRDNTSLPITLQAFQIGATNAWCQLDTNPVPHHAQNP